MKKNNHVRWMVRRDLASVLAIEYENFEFPWQEEDFVRFLKKQNRIGMVSEDKYGIIEGFMIYEIYPTKIDLVNLAVGERYTKQGVGTGMVQKLIQKLNSTRKTISLNVREGNLSGQQFFKSLGFKATNVLYNYYGPFYNENAYHMVYGLEVPEKKLKLSY